MQFNPVSFSAARPTPSALALSRGLKAPNDAPPGPRLYPLIGRAPKLAEVPQRTPPEKGGGPRQGVAGVTENLLKHIPGEASGFYLLASSSLTDVTTGRLGLIFALSLILLVVVRWLALASWGIMLTSIGAFALWMLIFDKGYLHAIFPDVLPSPLGLIVASFYSALITLLASAGKIC